MLIDDHPAMGIIFKTMLTAMGYGPADFDYCKDVESAVESLQANPPYNIIFLDNIVPPAFEFRGSLALMDSIDDTTRIVLLSGQIPDDFGSEAIDARVDICMEKDTLSAKSLHSVLTSFDTQLAS